MMRRILLTVIVMLTMLFTEGCGMMSDGRAEELYQAILADDTGEVRRMVEKDPWLLNRPRITNPILRLSDSDNRYPLEAACYTSAEMAEILLDAGADVNVIDPYIKSTPLINALWARYPERYRIAFRLIEEGADINVVDQNYRTALNACVVPMSTDTEEARETQAELLEYLLEHCDLYKVVSESRKTPLIEAASFGNSRAVKYLLENNYFLVDDMPNGYTALMVAAGMGKTDICQVLLDYGADTELRSYKGKTAADYAEESGHPELADLLKSRQ